MVDVLHCGLVWGAGCGFMLAGAGVEGGDLGLGVQQASGAGAGLGGEGGLELGLFRGPGFGMGVVHFTILFLGAPDNNRLIKQWAGGDKLTMGRGRRAFCLDSQRVMKLVKWERVMGITYFLCPDLFEMHRVSKQEIGISVQSGFFNLNCSTIGNQIQCQGIKIIRWFDLVIHLAGANTIQLVGVKYQITHSYFHNIQMMHLVRNIRKAFSSEKSETKVFFQSVTSTVKGYLNPNYIQEHNPNLTEAEKAASKRFLIYRYDPENPNDEPKYISYYINLKNIPPMYLDALIYIKDNYDPTLSFRRSCREGICGSCAMNCDGLHSLACIREIDTNLDKAALITPLGHMFVLKDLVVDMTNFYSQYKSIQPYLKRKQPKGPNQRQYYQSPEDRKKLDGLYECVLCACCSTSCPSYWWHPDTYLGPAVLMQSYRWIVDSRDQYTRERLEQLSKDMRLEQCQNIGMCSVTCPKGLNPQGALQHLLKMIEEMNERTVERVI